MSDAAMVAHAKRMGVPLDSLYPSKWWIACLHRDSVEVTATEVLQIREFIEFKIRTHYREGYAERMLAEKPLPWDAGHNTTIFAKRKYDDDRPAAWFYRRGTWTQGPALLPSPLDPDFHPYTLVEVMDREQTILGGVSPHWITWKRLRPTTFPLIALRTGKEEEVYFGMVEVLLGLGFSVGKQGEDVLEGSFVFRHSDGQSVLVHRTASPHDPLWAAVERGLPEDNCKAWNRKGLLILLDKAAENRARA